MPTVGDDTAFELAYMAELEATLAPFGLMLKYESDLAALDLGLHLYEQKTTSLDRSVGSARVWLQCKGKRAASLSAERIALAESIPIGGLPLDTVLYWYAAPEPVYLVLYLEATDEFLAADVRDIVDRMGGFADLAARQSDGQSTVTLRIPASSSLDAAVAAMPRHKSLRIDGPLFRGRPLGHRVDPMRSELAQLGPGSFTEIVARLLDAHGFKREADVPLADTFASDASPIDAFVGVLYFTFEWVNPLFTEFGHDAGDTFRIEGTPEHAQGRSLVIVQSEVSAPPRPTVATRELLADLQEQGVGGPLLFYNASESDSRLLGSWRNAVRPFEVVPQGLGTLAYSILTTTSVFLDVQNQLRWSYLNYLVEHGE